MSVIKNIFSRNINNVLKSNNAKVFVKVVIEESKTDPALLVNSFPGMLLPPFGDLSHTSIL
ncbi:MAG: hypothetical protein QN732_11585, partial [Nitrososphaeraceae archaeon]|nr:hypothetical protein [Nitrososphaeraceae archaeon]